MAVYLYALTANGGVPLFSRMSGDAKPLPYPVIGSINGVHMYGRNHGAILTCSESADFSIHWKDFHDSVTLIMLASKSLYGKSEMEYLTNLAFNALVLLYGLDDIVVIKNVERFKKEIRVCFGLLDYLINWHKLGFCDVMQCIETVACDASDVIQKYTDAFAEAAGSLYCCLLINGKVCSATKRWWNLAPGDQLIMCAFIASLLPATSRDLPVYLPEFSPQVPYRLLTYCLQAGVEVAVLCGPTPGLSHLQKEVERLWRASIDPLQAVLALAPRCMPADAIVDQNILGYLVHSAESGKSLGGFRPEDEDSSRWKQGTFLKIQQRRKLMRDFICFVRMHHFTQEPWTGHGGTRHRAAEAYSVSEDHKCHALWRPPHQLFVLYSPSAPTYAMRWVLSACPPRGHVCRGRGHKGACSCSIIKVLLWLPWRRRSSTAQLLDTVSKRRYV